MRKEHRDVQEYAEESHKQAILEDDFIGQELPCKAVQDTPVAESREGALPIQKDKGLIEVSLVPIPIATGEETTKAVPTTWVCGSTHYMSWTTYKSTRTCNQHPTT